MAVDMQRRLAQLNGEWRQRGVEQPFRARMGINTGYCNVGNFGSDDRMDYTIIGAEANLAARLQQTAQPGEIVLMHVGSHPDDGSTLDADALPEIIAQLRAAGYAFVTLDVLLQQQ
jgi:peptidoglycan/xylan/chitin deacetylase (PgdA/CDA1 family)